MTLRNSQAVFLKLLSPYEILLYNSAMISGNLGRRCRKICERKTYVTV